MADFGVSLICETVLEQPRLLAGDDGFVFDCAVQCGTFGGNGEKIICSLLIHGSHGFHVDCPCLQGRHRHWQSLYEAMSFQVARSRRHQTFIIGHGKNCAMV
jgi:hypothetical protein